MNEELLKTLDGIEKYLEKITVKQRAQADEILEIRQRGVQMPDFNTGGDFGGNASGSLGAQAAKAFEANRDLFSKTRSVGLELKAAADAVTTASGRRLVSGGVGAPGGGVLGLQNGLPSRQAGGTSAIGACADNWPARMPKRSKRPKATRRRLFALTIRLSCKAL